MSNEPRLVSNGHLGSEITEEKSFAVLIHALTVVQSFCVWVDGAIRLRGAITKGRVTGRWARRHHRMWLLTMLVNGSVLKRTASVERIPFQ
jgi:formate dehydrogenase subunit gamma